MAMESMFPSLLFDRFRSKDVYSDRLHRIEARKGHGYGDADSRLYFNVDMGIVLHCDSIPPVMAYCSFCQVLLAAFLHRFGARE